MPQNKLLTWYKEHGRDHLPWRQTDNIYHIYVSEIMLQQTQVNRVMEEYYPNFLEQFPRIEDLANAKEEEVIAAWSGLGYYSRARNLHKTAKECVNGLPNTKKELLKLPGIGEYTASAICSFGYHQDVGVVDTNISRVLKRYFGLKDVKNEIVLQYAKDFVNKLEPRAHNLALMDLGSMVCTPRTPKCDICPLEFNCKGKDEPELYTQKKKVQYEDLELFLGICIKEDKIGLIKSDGKMYKNMLVLPNVDPIEEKFITSFKHAYTKYRITVKLYEIEEYYDDLIWIEINQLKDAPVASLTTKAIKNLDFRINS
jgi:A/G-specific adenine glycosylase